MFLMSFTDIFLALPSMLSNGYSKYLLKSGPVYPLIAVLSLFSWAPVARITRAETMSVKETRLCDGHTESGGIKLSGLH